MNETPHVIVPCAGFGKRFKDVGYAEDKPLIKVGGKTLLEWSLSCLPASWRSSVSAVIRDGQMMPIDLIRRVVPLKSPSQGAACSVLAVAVGLPPEDSVLVMNADQFIRHDLQMTYAWAMLEKLDGFVLTFPGTGPAWSYAVTNGTNRVVHVIEKKQVSNFATCGLYWWRRAGDLVRSICAMIASGQKTNQEFYLAPAYNFAPLSEKNVQIVEVAEFHGLGTPEQVREFEALLKSGWKP